MTDKELRALAMQAALRESANLGGVEHNAKVIFQWLRDGGPPGEYAFSLRYVNMNSSPSVNDPITNDGREWKGDGLRSFPEESFFKKNVLRESDGSICGPKTYITDNMLVGEYILRFQNLFAAINECEVLTQTQKNHMICVLDDAFSENTDAPIALGSILAASMRATIERAKAALDWASANKS